MFSKFSAAPEINRQRGIQKCLLKLSINLVIYNKGDSVRAGGLIAVGVLEF